MNTFLQGKQAVVTGGTRGIGRAIAAALARAGAAVAICGRSEESVAGAVDALKRASDAEVIGKAADIRNGERVSEFFQFVDERFGGLDILINNAGVGIFRPVGDMTVAEWRQSIDTNLTGVFLCCREALLHFRRRGGGFVINISSLAGRNPFATGAAYNASKFGLNGFTEAMMMDHRHDNVRVSYIMPGSVDTGFTAGSSGQPAEWKIAAGDVAETVLSVLRMPERTLISRVEIRPSKPRK